MNNSLKTLLLYAFPAATHTIIGQVHLHSRDAIIIDQPCRVQDR